MKQNTKYTPGPWVIFNGRIEHPGQFRDTVICRLEDIAEKDANSALIKAGLEA
jgi:hypothetical protein